MAEGQLKPPEEVEHSSQVESEASKANDRLNQLPPPLNRRSSTPARLESNSISISIVQQQQHNVTATGSQASAAIQAPNHLDSHPNHVLQLSNNVNSYHTNSSSSSNIIRHHRMRHSYCGWTRQQAEVAVNKSTSSHSSSSSTGDSAFSQSQTTLGSSESEHASDIYRRSSLKETSNGAHHFSSSKKADEIGRRRCLKRKSYDKHDDSEDGSEPPMDQEEVDDVDNNHFKIVWRNLSYRVPEKRFARLNNYIKRQKERFLPSGEDSLDEQVVIEDLHSSTQNSEEEEVPMRPPVTGKPRKVIFSNLNGCVKSGQLTAILGPSGAGKTTFLKCLTNTIVKGVTGSIDITGGTATSHLKLCIIPQKDYLFDNLTVMENLIFASRIKNTQPNFDHKQNVERVANLLGLQTCLKLKSNKLSGGQYKRVSIAQELLSKPDILILDEPTSGLDSLTCFRTVSVLRDLVNMSRAGLMPPLAILMTIHQPQIKIFNLFHHVYILSSMGQCVFEGRPENLIDTVADCCKLLPPPDDLNPASFIIDVASEVYGSKPVGQLADLQRENFQLLNPTTKLDGGSSTNSSSSGGGDGACVDDKSNNLAQIELYVGPQIDKIKKDSLKLDKESGSSDYEFDRAGGDFKIDDRLKRRNNHNSNYWLHTGLLIKRLWISMWRDPLLTTTRVTFHLIIPFVFYFIYSQKSGMANACPHVEREFDFQTMTSEANIHRLETQHNELILTFENVSLFFLLLYSFSMCVLAVTALSFPLNMQILLKETSNGWYSMPRFVMAKTLADLPMELTMPAISVAIAYVLTGQPSSYLCWRMLTVTAVMTLCSLISQTQGLLFGAYFMNNVQAAVFISQASSLPWIMLSGFTTRVSELPVVLQWLSFGSIYRLGIESIVSVRYGFGMCPCDQELVNNTPAKMVGIPDQLRSVMRYYLDMYSDPPTNSTEDIFEKIASTLSRANTYGVNVVNCHDVRPFILSAREVDEGTLPTFILILVLIFVGLKILLFWVVRLRAV